MPVLVPGQCANSEQPALSVPHPKRGGRRAWDVSGFRPVELEGPRGECPTCGAHVIIGQHRHRPLQTLDQQLLIHARDCRCSSEECPSPDTIFRPLEEHRLALRLCGFGVDVVYLVMDRYFAGVSLPKIHQLLTEKYGLQISQTHVGNLLRLGLALVRCRDVGSEHLKARLRAQGGIVVSADAVSFDQTSPALYVLRDVLSSEVLSARRLELRGAAQLIPLFEEVKKLDVPILGIISDKEAALVDAAAEVFPGSPHHYCHLHYLQNLAKPMEAQMQQVGRGVRAVVRQVRDIEKGLLKRQQQQDSQGSKPSSDDGAGSEEPTEVQERQEAEAELKTVRELCRVVGAVGKSRGDSLLDPTPLKRFQKLEGVEQAAKRANEREGGPWPLLTKLLAALALLASCREQANFLLRQVNVLRTIAHILKMQGSGTDVKGTLQAFLDQLRNAVSQEDQETGWSQFVDHVVAVSGRWGKGLFHCYDNPSLPSTNNALEGFWGALKMFSRRVTGRQSTSGGPIETCAEFFVEAFSIFRNSKDPDLLWILSDIPEHELARARDEFKKLAEPARDKRSIARDTDKALARILQQWSGCPPDSG